MHKNRVLIPFLGFFCASLLCAPPIALAEDKKKQMEKNFKDRVLSKIPYSDKAEHMWNIVDGDVDLMGIEGLRGDRRNKGLKFTTDSLPMLGTIDGVKFQFQAGDTNKFSFKSNVTPFIGNVEGLTYRGYTSNENSAIFARYTISLD